MAEPKIPADAEFIGRSLRPYPDGRDWVSINRGEVVTLVTAVRELETGHAAVAADLPSGR